MATVLTRFEVRLPYYSGTDSNGNLNATDIATNNFRASIGSLVTFAYEDVYVVNTDGTHAQNELVYGELTPAQNTTALGYLNTLNAALGYNVFCVTYAVTTRP
jgi:hypothetical protein